MFEAKRGNNVLTTDDNVAVQGEDCLRDDDIIDFIKREADSIALVMLSGVQYYTGQLFDIPRITKVARELASQ